MTAGIGGLASGDQQSPGATGGAINFSARARGTATRTRKTGPAPGLYFLLVIQPAGREDMRHCQRCVHDRAATTPARRSIPESRRHQNRVDRNPTASHQCESVTITARSCQWSDNVCPLCAACRGTGVSLYPGRGRPACFSGGDLFLSARELIPGMWCIPRPGPTGGARHRCPATATSTARRRRCRPHFR